MNNQKRARGLFLQGLASFNSGDLAAAESQLLQAVELDPHRTASLTHLALTLLGQGRTDDARPWAEKAIQRDPKAADAWFVLGECHAATGAFDQAHPAFEKAVQQDARHAGAWRGLGNALAALGRLDHALACLGRSMEIAPDKATTWLEQGIVLQRQWKLQEALASVEKAASLAPTLAQAWERKGAILLLLKRNEQALEALDQAVRLQPGLAMAWFGRGNVMQALDRYEDALDCYDRAIAADSSLDDAWSARASLYVSDVGNVGRAIAESRRSWSSYIGGVIRTLASRPESITMQRFRLKHDVEQARYLLAGGYRVEGIGDFLAAGEGLLAASRESDAVLSPSARDWSAMLPYIGAPLYFPMPELPGTCINPAIDWAAIEDAYLSGTPQLVAIDQFLSAEALAAFREFALVSKVWLAEYVNKYLGAFANRGFLSPLHLQLARELARTMPRVFRNYRLTQLWGFKYDATMEQGINVHADFARVNLNFWLTPDEFNLDPAHGGLKVYDVPSPGDWPSYDYNENEKKIYGFLSEQGARCITVPHRCNRAVLFNSALFHETDEIHFRPGYESRRINFTYLFGRQL